MNMTLPTVREEFTQLALVYHFDMNENGLYGYWCEQNPESDELAVCHMFIEWMHLTLEQFPDLVTYSMIENQGRKPKLAVWVAGVFVCLFADPVLNPDSDPVPDNLDEDTKRMVNRARDLVTKCRVQCEQRDES